MNDNPNEGPARNGWLRLRRCFLVIGILGVILFDCWLIADQDVVPIQPLNGMDDGFFMSKAMCAYWFDEGYSTSSMPKEPIYPLFIWASHQLGLPLRLATEALYVAAAGFLAWCLVRRQFSAGAGLLVFAVCVLHPIHYFVFQRTLYDTIYPSLVMLAVGSLLLQFKLGNGPGCWAVRLLTGVALGLLWNTRADRPWVLGFLALFLAAAAVRAWRRGPTRRAAAGALAAQWVLPLALLAAITLGIKAANYARWGLFVTTDQEAPGFAAALRSLMRIRPEHPRRGLLVSREAVHRAYAVSPSLREIAGFLDQAMDNTAEYEVGRGLVDLPPGEDGGLFRWDLRWAMESAGHYRSAPETDAYYHQIAKEIDAALADGRLPSRWVPMVSLDPCFREWLPLLLPSAWDVYARCLESAYWAEDLVDGPETPRETVDAYNRTARRWVPPRGPDRTHARVRQWIALHYGTLLWAAMPAAGLIAAAVFLVRRAAPASTAYLLSGAALALAGLSRLGFVALADANMVATPPEARLYLPAALLLTATAAWLVGEGVHVLGVVVRQSWQASPPEAAGFKVPPGRRNAAVIVGLAALLLGLSGLAVQPAGRVAQGNLDQADGTWIRGWAWRPALDRPVEVAIFDGDDLLATVVADRPRADLVALGFGDGNYGFEYPTPARLRDGRPHIIQARAAGIRLGRKRVQERAIQELGVGSAPEGHLDVVDGDHLVIGGWAWDRNEPQKSVSVEIFDADTLLATVTADQSRPDLRDAGIGDGRHGFVAILPAALRDGKTHTIRVKIAGAGQELNGSPGTLTVPGAPVRP